MTVRFVDRKYIIKKLFRFEKMRGVGTIGFKIAIGKYEIRFYY